MQNYIKLAAIILASIISINIFASDIGCAYKNKGDICNYHGYPHGNCVGTSNHKTEYCGDTGERCLCGKPDYVE